MGVTESFIKRCIDIVGSSNVLTNESELKPLSHDEYPGEELSVIPSAAIRVGSEEEISSIVKLCAEENVPITVRGGGTGLSGACVPSPGGVVMLMERLNKVIDADKENQTITVEAGMTLRRLYEEVEKMGLFFPPHPGDEGAFVGGVVATNAGGARAVKYGTVKRFVIGLSVVLSDGSKIELGGKFIKSSTGYNLLDLMIGSEGTLGIITKVTFTLHPKPGDSKTLVIPFNNLEEAIDSVPHMLQTNIVPAAVEFVEHSVLKCVEKLLNKKWPAKEGTASLMVILDGRDEEDVMAQAEALSFILEDKGAIDILLAETKEKQEEVLQMRSMLYEALRPGVAEIFDITVPRSEIANHVKFVHSLERELGIQLPTYGHAADGNVHTHFMRRYIREDGSFGEEMQNWHELIEKVRLALFEDAKKRGGVISGEHGIGLAKKEYLKKMVDDKKLELMRAIKKVFDHRGILNPGKVI